MNLNFTNSSDDASFPRFDQSYKNTLVAWFSIVSTLNIFGFCNNLLLLIVILKEQRTGSGILIGHLVFLYLLMCCLCYPTINIIMFRYPFGLNSPANICNWGSTLHRTVFLTANWTDVCLAINRLVAVWFPRHYQQWTRTTVIVGMLLFSWIAGFSQTLPMAFGIGRKYLLTPEGFCEQVSTFSASSKALSLLGYMGNLAPYVVCGVAALAILVRIVVRKWQRLSRVGHVVKKTLQAQRLDRDMVVAKMLTVSFLCNCLSFIPNWVLAVYFHALHANISMLAKWLKVAEEAQYSLNSLIFWGMNRNYRKALRSLLRWGYPSARSGTSARQERPGTV